MRSFRVALLLCAALLAGCAARERGTEYDPLQPVNRKIFWFNDQVDIYVLEPAATAWNDVLPDAVQRSISRFFANLLFPSNTVNNLLQGKPKRALGEVGRFAVNSTVGVLGFMDPAKSWGLEPHPEDFGQTLGWWKVNPGPYLVLPFFGPSDVRDTIGLVGDYAAEIYPFYVVTLRDTLIVSGGRTVYIVNERSLYLKEVKAAKEAAIDYYSFVRNAYLQSRRAAVNDTKESSTPADNLYEVEGENENETK